MKWGTSSNIAQTGLSKLNTTLPPPAQLLLRSDVSTTDNDTVSKLAVPLPITYP